MSSEVTPLSSQLDRCSLAVRHLPAGPLRGTVT
jgi:hypothetical protein